MGQNPMYWVVACPKCGAAVDEPCHFVGKPGTVAQVNHRARWDAYGKYEEEHGLRDHLQQLSLPIDRGS